MARHQLRTASEILEIGLAILVAFLVVARPAPGKSDGPPTAALKAGSDAGQISAYSWRSEVYQPPDFQRFFPDDPKGAGALAALWDEVRKERDRQEAKPNVGGRISWWKQKGSRADNEILSIVRRGLRRIDNERRVSVIRWIGVRYVSDANPQNPDAIEILYHAVGYRGHGRYDNPTCHFAQGSICQVRPKSRSVLRALTELAMREDNPEILSTIVTVAWEEGPGQREEMLSYLAPYLASGDAAIREKARGVEQMFKNQIDAWEWAIEPARRRALAIYGARLPDFRKALISGTVRTRMETFALLSEERIDLILDDSFLAPLRACAEAPEEDVRSEVVNVIDAAWFWKVRNHPEAIALVLKLLKDESPTIQDHLFRNLLARKEAFPEPVVRALVGIILDGNKEIDRELLSGGLGQDRGIVKKILDEQLRGTDPLRAGAARQLYRDLAGAEPPNDTKLDGPYAKPFSELYVFLGRSYPNFRMKGIDWSAVGRELLPRASAAKNERDFGLLVEELVARLEDTHAIVIPGSARPPTPDYPLWDPGFACLIDDRGRPVVYHVDPGSPASRAGIAPGMAVVSVDGAKMPEVLERCMRQQRTYVGYSSERLLKAQAAWGLVRKDRKGAKTTLVLEAPDGHTKSIEVAADLGPRYLPRLPVPRAGIVDSADVSWTKLDGRLGYIYIRRIRPGLEASLNEALRGLGDIKGLVIDVRGNSGGGFNTSTAFVNFDSSPAAGTNRPRFAGPIALLIDERTVSAGEGWASWFVARKRARVFGTASAGASSRKVTYELTNGLYKIVVPVKAYTGFLDRPIERRGLEPDVAVRCTALDLSRGRDTVLEAAVAWLRKAEKQ